MKAAVLIVAALMALPGFADEASRQAKAEEMVALTIGPKMMDQMFASMKQMFAGQISPGEGPEAAQRQQEFSDKLWALMQKRMSWEKMRPLYAKVYAEVFTEPELDGILGFYKSPAGAATLAKMPLVMQKSVPIAQEMMKDMMSDVQALVKETLTPPVKPPAANPHN